ncbi:OmpA family protein [Tenacibaculum xiamenense]|uniref:OmpA family protein n=1 Tax=Tenacibaculum xiamenense TaxID=1261553 RepID=UPI003895C115
MKTHFYIVVLIFSTFFSCKKEVKSKEKNTANTYKEKENKSTGKQKTFFETTEEFAKSVGLNNDTINKSFQKAKAYETLAQDSSATINLLDQLLKESAKRKEEQVIQKRTQRKKHLGNMDDLLEAFDVLNKESGVASTINKLKKVDSMTGKNSFQSLKMEEKTIEAMSQKTAASAGKMTKKEQQLIQGFIKTKRNLHSIEEVKKFENMLQTINLDSLVKKQVVSQAFAHKQQSEIRKSIISLRDREKKAKIAEQKFKKLNPNLYFGAEVGATYFGTRATAVYLPLGKQSFADKVIDCSHPENIKTAHFALGEPDAYEEGINKLANAHSLGLNGTLTVKFEDNALVNVNGSDLYIFEMGAIEPTLLEISKDGENWISVGKIEGGVAEVDIEEFVKPNELYYYVRLTDLETRSKIPGADVDAIACIGSAVRLNLDSQVLFDSGKSELKEEGKDALKLLADNILILNGGTIIVEGHTDDIGSAERNRILSLARAKSVALELEKRIPDKKFKWLEKGFGETKPLVENSSEENRRFNRRVEVLILPN